MPLRLLLPPIDRPGADTPVAWCLIDARGTALREGMSALGSAPAAEPIDLILPASRVLFARLKLPKVGASTLRELLPYAVEDKLLADPSQIHAVPGPALANGDTLVAVIDRNWLEAGLAWARSHGHRIARVVCESALVPDTDSAWHVRLAKEAAFLVESDGYATAFDPPGDGAPPFSVRVALNEARDRAALPGSIRVQVKEAATMPDAKAWQAALELPVAVEALRHPLAGPLPPNAIDLLTGDLARGPSSTQRFALPRATWALAAAVAALSLGLVGFDTWQLESEREALEAEREALFRAAFPEARTVVDPALQMRRNLADLRRSRGEGAPSEFLSAAAEAVQGGPVPVKKLTYANGKADVQREGGNP